MEKEKLQKAIDLQHRIVVAKHNLMSGKYEEFMNRFDNEEDMIKIEFNTHGAVCEESHVFYVPFSKMKHIFVEYVKDSREKIALMEKELDEL